jgi:hypothetical protein
MTTLNSRPTTLAHAGQSECVHVSVRCRPMNSDEKSSNRNEMVQVDSDRCSISISKNETENREFTFDHVFSPSDTQESVYRLSAQGIVENVLQGYNGTIFCYGQTGAGKTYTMIGSKEDPGIIPRVFSHIFTSIEDRLDGEKFLISVSFLELYNEEIRDLLQPGSAQKLEITDNPDQDIGGVAVKNLSSVIVKSVKEISQLLNIGLSNRTTGSTMMNADSSRSHSLFSITIESSTDDHVKVGKLNLVDLAGSERQSKTRATGDTLKEAAKINLSLSCLGNVISALVEQKFVPYRDSKLTRLLQDSLGGNTKTAMIANVGPADYNYEETLSTLRYANRAKNIKNRPRINEDPKDAMIRDYEAEIARLRFELAGRGKGEESIEAGIDSSVLSGKLAELEATLVQGKEYVERAKRNERELVETKKLLRDREREHAQIREQFQQHLDEKLDIEQQMATHLDEAESLREKLQIVVEKYKAARGEVGAVSRDRESLLQTLRELEKVNKLNEEIILRFVPSQLVKTFEARAKWDDLTCQWVIEQEDSTDFLDLVGESATAPIRYSSANVQRPASASRYGRFEDRPLTQDSRRPDSRRRPEETEYFPHARGLVKQIIS